MLYYYLYYLLTVPEGVPAPFITSTGQRVLITLTPPTTPNGIILEYQVERSLAREDNYTVIGVLDGASIALALVDTDTEPFTTYEYRVVAVNSAGAARGPAANITTPEAGKCFLLRIISFLSCFFFLSHPPFSIEMPFVSFLQLQKESFRPSSPAFPLVQLRFASQIHFSQMASSPSTPSHASLPLPITQSPSQQRPSQNRNLTNTTAMWTKILTLLPHTTIP